MEWSNLGRRTLARPAHKHTSQLKCPSLLSAWVAIPNCDVNVNVVNITFFPCTPLNTICLIKCNCLFATFSSLVLILSSSFLSSLKYHFNILFTSAIIRKCKKRINFQSEKKWVFFKVRVQSYNAWSSSLGSNHFLLWLLGTVERVRQVGICCSGLVNALTIKLTVFFADISFRYSQECSNVQLITRLGSQRDRKNADWWRREKRRQRYVI